MFESIVKFVTLTEPVPAGIKTISEFEYNDKISFSLNLIPPYEITPVPAGVMYMSSFDLVPNI